MSFGKKIDELFALRLLASCVKTGNPDGVLRVAQDILTKKGKSGEVSVIEDIRYRISELGESLAGAFHGAGAISDETYGLLSVMEEKGGISPEPVESMVSVQEDMKKVKGEVFSMMLMPVLTVALTGAVVSLIITKVWSVIEAMKLEPPSVFALHMLIAKNPVAGGIALSLFCIAAIVFIIQAVLNRSVSTEINIFSLAGIVSALRSQKVSYADIFRHLSLTEKNSKMRNVYSDIAHLAESEDPSDFLLPLTDFMPVETSASFISYIKNNEELRAWSMLKDVVRTRVFNKVKGLASTFPLIAYVFVFIMIVFGGAPMGFVLTKITSMLSGGGV